MVEEAGIHETTGLEPCLRADEDGLALQEILSALSFALDLTEGAVPGHALRCVLLGMRIAIEIGLPDESLSSLYYALHLKDVGCSSNSARVAQLFGGDDRHAKALSKTTDWTGLLRPAPGSGRLSEKFIDWVGTVRAAPRQARALWSLVLPQGGAKQKLQRLAHLGKHAEGNLQDMVDLRCDRGAYILRKLEMSEAACAAVHGLDEHWDGSGYPERLTGKEIPLLARICAVAQHLDVFATAAGQKAAMRALARRKGTWFDPALVRIVQHLHRSGRLWKDCEPFCPVDRTRATAMALSPDVVVALPADRIDTISEAFAAVVDAKSPFTYRHSMGVTVVAVALAQELGLGHDRIRVIRRAALLHDLGKLGVPNSILDKPGKLTDEERSVVFAHPLLSASILSRIAGFGEIARLASEHHEKLDGTGYPQGLKEGGLSLESRLLTVADMFAAMAEDRPYRAPMPLDTVMRNLWENTPQKLDKTVMDALEGVLDRWNGRLPEVFTKQAATDTCELPEFSGTRELAEALP